MKKKALETRSLDFIANVEPQDGKKYITGIIPYNSRSQYMYVGYSDCNYEMLAPTVFNKTLADNADIYVNYAHNDEHILARLSAGTLELNNTIEGLEFKMTVPDTPWGQEAYGTIESGNCRTISFEFIPYTWVEGEDNTVTLTSAKLTAISLCVVNPAYLETDTFASIRKLIRANDTEKLTDENIKDIKSIVSELSKMIPGEEKEQTTESEQQEQSKPDTPKEDESIDISEYESKVEKLTCLLDELDNLVTENKEE